MNESTVPFLRDLFPLEWKMLFSYIEHRNDSWNRNLEVLHSESSPLISYNAKRCVLYMYSDWAASHPCSSFRCANRHSPSFLFEFQSSVKVCCFLPHLNVQNTGSNLKQNMLINSQRVLYLVKRHQRVYMEIGG